MRQLNTNLNNPYKHIMGEYSAGNFSLAEYYSAKYNTTTYSMEQNQQYPVASNRLSTVRGVAYWLR